MATHTIRDAIPIWHQIYLNLRDEILSGELAFGISMPTEQALGAIHGVSRTTARHVLDKLSVDGLVERKRRVGTRVAYRAPTAPIGGDLDRAVESLIAFGRETKVRVVEFGQERATAVVAERLGVAAGSGIVHALRVRSADGVPLGAIDSFVPVAVGAALSPSVLGTRPLLELIRAAGHSIGAGSQIISAVAADPALATLLEIEPRAPVIRVERLVRDDAGVPLLFTRARYRGDQYRLSVDFHAPGV